MPLNKAEKRLFNILDQNLIQGIIEEKMQRGETPDLKWINKTGFHFRIKRRTKLIKFFKKSINYFYRDKQLKSQNVIPIQLIKEKIKK